MGAPNATIGDADNWLLFGSPENQVSGTPNNGSSTAVLASIYAGVLPAIGRQA